MKDLSLSIIILFAFSFNAVSQSLEEVKKNLPGDWSINIEKTTEIFETMKPFMEDYRKNEIEEILPTMSIYKINISADGTFTSQLQMGDMEEPMSGRGNWNLTEKVLGERELSLIEKHSLFEIWKDTKSGLSLSLERDGQFVMRCTPEELIVFDVGTPMVFTKSQ